MRRPTSFRDARPGSPARQRFARHLDIVEGQRPFADRLVEAGAPPGTRAVSLCVIATAPTDAEVLAGLKALDLGWRAALRERAEG